MIDRRTGSIDRLAGWLAGWSTRSIRSASANRPPDLLDQLTHPSNHHFFTTAGGRGGEHQDHRGPGDGAEQGLRLRSLHGAPRCVLGLFCVFVGCWGWVAGWGLGVVLWWVEAWRGASQRAVLRLPCFGCIDGWMDGWDGWMRRHHSKPHAPPPPSHNTDNPQIPNNTHDRRHLRAREARRAGARGPAPQDPPGHAETQQLRRRRRVRRRGRRLLS